LKGNERVNEILGQGHAIHDFGATFIYNSPDSKKYSWQFPIEFKFTSRPKGYSIIGGPLLYKMQGEDWQEYPCKDSIEELLLNSLQMVLRKIHNSTTISLPNVIKNVSEVSE
jgi:hypothetical protein